MGRWWVELLETQRLWSSSKSLLENRTEEGEGELRDQVQLEAASVLCSPYPVSAPTNQGHSLHPLSTITERLCLTKHFALATSCVCRSSNVNNLLILKLIDLLVYKSF